MQLFKKINIMSTLSFALIKNKGTTLSRQTESPIMLNLKCSQKKQKIIKFFHPFNLITELNEMMLRKLRWNHSINLRGRWGKIWASGSGCRAMGEYWIIYSNKSANFCFFEGIFLNFSHLVIKKDKIVRFRYSGK